MAMDALHTSDSPMNGGNVPLLFSVDCITRLHRTLASLAKGGGSAQAEPEGFFSRGKVQLTFLNIRTQVAAAAARPIPQPRPYISMPAAAPFAREP